MVSDVEKEKVVELNHVGGTGVSSKENKAGSLGVQGLACDLSGWVEGNDKFVFFAEDGDVVVGLQALVGV